MVPYTRNVVTVIKMGAYIHGCLFSMGAHYPGGGGGGGGYGIHRGDLYIEKYSW